ncbi:hypothetical protein OS493_026831 [Desmophyllum pertusum]|uniref:Uncharacterized protein n=1 Tax=Desmophyllum pertusum TaxID=174260 RepID=A0A9W9ZLL3_9CNID|nr:hypothetical protein OS493_026831 [Desmophyllum pertusum]
MAVFWNKPNSDKSATETVVDTEENSQEPDVKPKEDISMTVNSSSTIKTNSTHKGPPSPATVLSQVLSHATMLVQ